jgi:D-alanyl-D-alanine dipeptidase
LKINYTIVIFFFFWYHFALGQRNQYELVDLQQYIPHIKLDIRYATANNFTHQVLYPRAAAYLKLPAAKALKEVQEELELRGLGLLVFDGYRPFSVTQKMWEIVPDERYAANPAKGSGHNRGVAVDLSLYNLKTGQPLKMPTDFDNFTEMAHQSYPVKDTLVANNRKLLRDVMEKHGFVNLTTEWWHFYLKDAQQYPLLNIPFENL